MIGIGIGIGVEIWLRIKNRDWQWLGRIRRNLGLLFFLFYRKSREEKVRSLLLNKG